MAELEEREIREQIARIFGSEELAGSERLRGLLQYLVERELARLPPPKGYDIAIDVFGRSASFDPSTDAIVRVSVGRLRKQLAYYFATGGAADPIILTIPKGSYRVEIEPNRANEAQSVEATGPRLSEAEPASQAPGALVDQGQSAALEIDCMSPSNGVAILPFDIVPELREHAKADEARQIFGVTLNKAPMVDPVIVLDPDTPVRSAAEATQAFAVRYALSGRVIRVGTDVQLTIQLQDGVSGAIVWADLYSASMTMVEAQWLELITRLAGTIRIRLYEALHAQLSACAAEGGLKPMELALLASWMPTDLSNDPAHERRCIALAEEALSLDPRCGFAHSVLADKLAYLALMERQSDTPEILGRAAHHANQAHALAGDNADALLNLVLYYWHVGKRMQLRVTVERACNITRMHLILAIWQRVAPYVGEVAPVEVIDELIELDGRLAHQNPSRWMLLNWISRFYMKRHEFAAAKEYALKAYYIFLAPETGIRVAAASVQLGEIVFARSIIDDVRTRWPDLDLYHYADVALARQCGGGEGFTLLHGIYRQLGDVVATPSGPKLVVDNVKRRT